jgi:imidazolonepropionase-like amidohydrolase
VYRLRGVLLGPEGGRDAELFVDAAGLVAGDPLPGAETLVNGGFLVPGLVDAHCHVGIGPHGAVPLGEAEEQARTDRDAGALLLRDCGSPVDTTPLQRRSDLPEIVRAGRHLAQPKRYIPGLALELDDPALLPEAVTEQARTADGWVKLVGDWIDRGTGDLAPLWPDDVLVTAIAAAHAAGARVTAHVFGADALPGLIHAGIDCIEHGAGLTDELIDEMARRGTALVPTLINIDTFPGIAERAERFPAYAAHMRALHGRAHGVVRRAVEAGVPVFAGTDAGGGIRHGRIADEVVALHAAGLPALDALGAASWAAREWLDRPALVPGAPADLVVYRDDPRTDPAVLSRPALV